MFFENLVNTYTPFIFNFIPSGCNEKSVSYNLVTFRNINNDYLWLIGGGLVIFSTLYAYKSFKTNKVFRSICFLSFLVLLFNFCLHSLFGVELFLYSQHWITPVSLILATYLDKHRITCFILVIFFICNNAYVFSQFDSFIDWKELDTNFYTKIKD
jgi:hypothetical protein